MRRDKIQLLTSRIREEAVRLGFSKLGITSVSRLPDQEYFKSWLEKGYQGEMHYLERQAMKRGDPFLVLANAQTFLVLALNYYTGESVSNEPFIGRISRYAQGEDYHSVVCERLDLLLSSIQALEPSARGICFADTGPVMEKVWGARTSLGWIGKNTNLISKCFGSWFFIGVILLDLELEYDQTEPDHCGTCRRCMDSCPTGAIVAPYVLDARRCISYLTIELRGPIARALRPLIGNRIFGCDECQESCPWNRFAVATPNSAFLARERTPDLMPLAEISAIEFKRRFRNTPIWRAKRDGFVRNVVVALGNSGRDEAVQPLSKAALQDASSLVRSHAAWALGRIDSARARRVLEAARSTEKDPAVLEEVEIALKTS